MDGASLSQMSSGQPLQGLAPAPTPQNIDSQSFDPEITLSQSRPGRLQPAMFPSESLDDVPPELVSAGASDQPSPGGAPLEFNLSAPASPAEKPQPRSDSEPKSAPNSAPKLQPKLEPSQPKSQPDKSKAARKRRLAVLLIVVLVMLLIPPAGAFFWWQHFKSTPAYYLAMLVDAVHRNDKATVDQIVAVDQITDNFASQVTQSVLSQNTSAATGSERKQLESSLTGLAPTIKQMVREEVEKQVKDEAAPSAGKSLLTIALALYYKGGIKQTGDSATVAAQAHAVAWTMQRSDAGAWTIVALKDDALASQIQDQITSELPTTGGEKTRASASKQKNRPASDQQKNSTDSPRAKKKERKKPEKGFRIELPFPDLYIELRPASRN